jgi:hypothetical protein
MPTEREAIFKFLIEFLMTGKLQVNKSEERITINKTVLSVSLEIIMLVEIACLVFPLIEKKFSVTD